jgi:type I restriction enzyme, S subunit
MKHSGIEWIENIPSNWEVKKIKHLFQIIHGSTPESNNIEYWDGNIPWITPADMPDFGIISKGERTITKRGYNSCGTSILPKGSIIISTRAPIGKINITQTELCTNQGCKSLVSFNTHTKYYFYLFYAIQEELVRKGKGTTFIELGTFELCNFNILLPSLSEQRVIAAFLDTQCNKIDNIITELEQQIEILKQYKTSLITETVTKGLKKNVPMKNSGIDWIGKIPAHWEVKRLKYIGNAKNGLTYSPEDISNEGILVLRSSNIQEGKLAFEDNVYVDMKIPKDIIIKENDILICSRNGSRELIGKCALIDKKTEGNTYGAFMCVFRSPYNRFIHYIFQSNLFNYYLGNYLTSTINQLTNTNLHNMKIPITFDEKEQLQIVTYLDNQTGKIDNLISEKQQSIDTMKAYKKSLIYEYVTGKKRVTKK